MTTKKEYSLSEYEKNIDFGDFIRSIRMSDDVTQEELAKKIKCTKQYISGIENGKNSATIDVAKKFAHALGYSTSVFVEILLNSQLKKAKLKLRVEVKKSA